MSRLKRVSFILFGVLLASCASQVSVSPTAQLNAGLTPATTATETKLPATVTVSVTSTSTQTQTPLPTAPLAPTSTPIATLPAAQPLTLLAQRGGSAKGLALSGTTAYIGIGPRLEALEVSDPAAPRLLAQSGAMPGAVSGVLLFSAAPNLSSAAVSAGRYIEVLDISQPDKIIQVNEVALPGTINTMILDRVNWKLYAGGSIYQSYDPNSGPINSGYVAVVDLKDGIQLGRVVPLTSPVESLALAKSMLYAAHADDQGAIVLTGIPLVSATQLGQPVTLITSTVPAVSFSVQAAGDRLYIDSYNALVAYDITNPMAPKEQWRSRLGMLAYGFILQPGYIDAMGLAPVGDYALEPVRITPDEAVRTDPEISTASNVASAGDRTYLARDGLEIFNTSDPQNARPLGAYQPPLLVTIDAITQGDLVYTLDTDSFKHNWSQFLHVLRLPDLAIVSEYHFAGSDDAPGWEYFYSMEVEGDRLYLFDYPKGTWVFDLSNPLKPAYLNRPSQLSYGLSAATTGTLGSRRLIFKANPVDTSSALVVYDVTDLDNITILSSLDLKDETPQHLAWSGGLLYAVTQGYPAAGNSYSYWLEVFSLENNTLKLESHTPLAADSRLAAHGSLAALSSPQGLVIFSAADPAHPQILSQTPLAGSGAILAFLDNNRLLAALQGCSAQLLTFDLSDPAHTRLLSATDVPPAEYLTVSGATITLSSNFGGIEVLK